VNLISKATSAIIHPVRTATSVAGQTMGVAAAGARTTMRIIDRAAGQVRGGDSSDVWSTTDPADASDATRGGPEASSAPAATLVEPAARKAPAKKASAKKAQSKKAPAKKAAAKKAPARKATVKKAPSARAATIAPALSLTEEEVTEDAVRTPSGIPAADEGYNPHTAETDLHQPGTEPLMDPATVKSVRSEAEVMQRAADPDKG
jgi:hypothetical protein